MDLLDNNTHIQLTTSMYRINQTRNRIETIGKKNVQNPLAWKMPTCIFCHINLLIVTGIGISLSITEYALVVEQNQI